MPYKNYRLPELLEGAREGKGLTRQESIYLLDFDETSFESSLIRGTANALTRERLENSAVILGQIGLETDICTGGCRFCTFGNRDTQISSFRISDEVLRQKIEEFTINGDLYGLYLMTMHDYDMDRLLNAVRISKEVTPPQTQIWVNIGDSDLETYRILKNAGVQGAYHVNRLREGIDTNLSPKDRIRSMEHIIDAGLELYTCCEPIGPEHTNEELVENFFIGIDLGCTQHAVMKRIPVQNTPLAQLGQISEIRLAHIAAVVTLALGKAKSFKFMSIHEPNQVGLLSGGKPYNG